MFVGSPVEVAQVLVDEGYFAGAFEKIDKTAPFIVFVDEWGASPDRDIYLFIL